MLRPDKSRYFWPRYIYEVCSLVSYTNLGKVWTGIEARVVSVWLIILCGKILRAITALCGTGPPPE